MVHDLDLLYVRQGVQIREMIHYQCYWYLIVITAVEPFDQKLEYIRLGWEDRSCKAKLY